MTAVLNILIQTLKTEMMKEVTMVTQFVDDADLPRRAEQNLTCRNMHSSHHAPAKRNVGKSSLKGTGRPSGKVFGPHHFMAEGVFLTSTSHLNL